RLLDEALVRSDEAPAALDDDSIHHVGTLLQPAVFGTQLARRVVGEARHRFDAVPEREECPRHLEEPRLRCADLGREVVAYPDDLHTGSTNHPPATLRVLSSRRRF